MARTKQTARKSSKKPIEGTFGYSCTLYKDFLVLFGGEYDGEPITRASVYNLKEEKMEENQAKGKSFAFDGKFGHAACYYEFENIIIFFGGEPSHGGYEDASENPLFQLLDQGDGLSWNLRPGIAGQAMESPVGHIYENKLYMYQVGDVNGGFGVLRAYDINRQEWQEPHQQCSSWLHVAENKNTIFVQNKLYLFTLSEEQKPRPAGRNGSHLEDVHVLKIKGSGRGWERISSSGEAPGFVSYISMAEANGVIYIFGARCNDQGELKSVLWTYDTNEEKWSQVKDIGTLTARPNQRAVVYRGQLLIIDWDYMTQTIGIQYHNLNGAGENFISQSPSGKDLCKDEDESFIQDAKSLYNSKLFPDVVFEVEGEEIPAHKALLAYRSDYFMKMFTSGVSESQSAKIPISNMKPHVFKAILQYVYCNEVELDEQLALDLIPVLDECLMKGLKGLCEKYLCRQLRKENVVDMLIVADRHDIQELKKSCFKYILKNLGNIDENEEMMKLSKTLFIELLKFSTSGLQPKTSTKKEKKEEEEETKSNSVFGMKTATPMKTSAFPSQSNSNHFYQNAPVYNPTYPAYSTSGRSAALGIKSSSKSRSRSPGYPRTKAEK